MAFLHAQSCECLKSELLLFDTPPTQTTIESSHMVQYKPISSLSDDSPIEFLIPSNSEEYLDLAHTILHLQVSIKQQIATDDLPAARKAVVENVGPICNFMHSLFSQVDVFCNQKPVSPPNNAYAYRAYIETLLNYDPAAKNSHLTSVLYYADTPGHMEDVNAGNEGLVKRREMTKKKSFDLIGHLHCDVFNQSRLLLNGVEVRVRLVRSRDEFCLMDPANAYTIHIEEANLLVRRVKISPSIMLAHAKALNKTTAKYPLTRVEVKSFTMSSGTHGQTLDNIVLGQLPKRIIVAFFENKAFNGDRLLNPFNFQNFKVNFLCLYVDGIQIPSKPLQPNFDKGSYIDCYNSLFSGCGIFFMNEGNSISRSDYPNGYCIFAFDLTPDLSANDLTHWNLLKHGNVRLDVRFAESLKSTVNCIVYAEYENILEIDSSRQVIVDFSN